MKTFVVNDVTARTPIGEVLQSAADECLELRDAAGTLMATIIVPISPSREDDRYAELFHRAEQDRELIERRMKTPASRCHTTTELFEQLQQLDPSE